MALPLSVLPGMAYAADVATRNDAIAGMVVSERDYVSTWLTTLRNNWRMLGGQASMAFVTLLPGYEQLLRRDCRGRCRHEAIQDIAIRGKTYSAEYGCVEEPQEYCTYRG